MKKVIYAVTLAITAAVMAFASDTACFAAEMDNPDYINDHYYRLPTLPTVEEMICSLYENESDPIIRSMAIDSALVLTGCKAPMEYYSNGAVLVGRYQTATVEPSVQCTISLLGEHSMRLGSNGKQFAVSTSPGELLTQEAIARNIEDLVKIYLMVNMAKAATTGMDDIPKLWNIETCVKALAPSYVAGTDSVMAKTIRTGICDCEGYAALTYLFGINCGLNIKCVMGIANGGNHVWNEIVLNGRTYWHDTTWDKSTNSDLYFITSPRSYDPYEQYVVRDILQMNPTVVTY